MLTAALPAVPTITVTVSFSPRANEVDEVTLRLSEGASVADAVVASGLQSRHPGVDLAGLPIGVWGSLCDRLQFLRERDRVELYRPLTVDPKEARRLRYRAASKAKRAAK